MNKCFSNIDSVISTISSRCQKIFVATSTDIEIDEKYIGLADELIDNIESNGIKTIAKNPELYSIIKDRNELQKTYKIIFKKYTDALNYLINEKTEENIITRNNDIVKISKKILIINDNIHICLLSHLCDIRIWRKCGAPTSEATTFMSLP